MMWKPQREALKRWLRICEKDVDSLHDLSPGAWKNLRTIINPSYWANNNATAELLRIIDAARWGDGITLWHFKGASLASEVAKFWQGKASELEDILSCSNQASEFEALKHLYPSLHVGRLLGRLVEESQGRVAPYHRADARLWIIRPPGI